MCLAGARRACDISIHALREEGDSEWQVPIVVHLGISIHALREEGDSVVLVVLCGTVLFLSTPSVRRATVTVYS